MKQSTSILDKIYPNIDYKSNEERLKNKILVIFLFITSIFSITCHVFSRIYKIDYLVYSTLITLLVCSIIYFLISKGKILLTKTLYIQTINILLFITVMIFPKETSFNILYIILFFLTFCIFELNKQFLVFINSLIITLSFIVLEYLKLNFHETIALDYEKVQVLFYLNMSFFFIGMTVCIYYYLLSSKKYRQEIIEKESNLNAVVENSQRAIWSIDTDYNIITMNENFIKTAFIVSGFDPKIGDNATKFLPPNYNLDHWVNLLKSTFEGKNCSEELNIIYNEKEIFLEINMYPILNKDNGITAIALFGRDITNRKKNAEILNSKNKELIKANKELDLLVYRASHDLRAPLMSILGLIKITELEFPNTKDSVNFELMNKSIKKLDSYIQDIINLSRNSRTSISLDTINFQKIVDEQIASLIYFEHSEHIEIVKEITKKSPFISDAKRLEIVFNNLISNAMKYHNINQVNPFIKISIFQNEVEAIITISDNGLGIDEYHLEHVFNMFYRASTDSKGSGLGLYIVKDAISKLNGKIEIGSEIGKGTTFNFIIPNNISQVQDMAKA